jgi:uncharacterized membrane protein YfhO
MFDARHDPFAMVLLDRDPPAAAGDGGDGVALSAARVVLERNMELVVHADIGASGGYLNVVDSYDPFWVAEVDGTRAPLLRANGLFRAVRLTPGRHEVRFRYRPTQLYAGAAISGITAVMLLLAWWWGARRPRERPG